jgi:hypothetical protein
MSEGKLDAQIWVCKFAEIIGDNQQVFWIQKKTGEF